MASSPLAPAYRIHEFMEGREARGLRIMAEYLEPLHRFRDQEVEDTIVFMGSARTPEPERAARALEKARAEGGDVVGAEEGARMAQYYAAARELARRLTAWSLELGDARRFVVCTGGGPGIMAAANRGAIDAGGRGIGLEISIPVEEFENPHVTPELAFQFHYFFMRKFWFAYLAKAVIVFPGGFGTLDELFELLTLIQTGKIRKRLPIVLFGTRYWREVVDFDALVRHGTISARDIDLVFRTDSTDEAYRFVTEELGAHGLPNPGATL